MLSDEISDKQKAARSIISGIGKAEGFTFSVQGGEKKVSSGSLLLGGTLIRLPCKTSSVPATCFVRWSSERKKPRFLGTNETCSAMVVRNSFHSSHILQSDFLHFLQIAGIVSITDASGFGFKHLRAIGLEDGKNMVISVFRNSTFSCPQTALWMTFDSLLKNTYQRAILGTFDESQHIIAGQYLINS